MIARGWMRNGLRRAALLGAVLAPAGALAAPPPTPPAFIEATTTAAPTAPTARWWRLFGDPQLDALIDRADRDNTDIAVARARLAVARAALRGARADRLPRIDAVAAAAEQTGTLVTASGESGSLFELGGRVAWEPDIFGHLGKQARAARADAGAAAALVENARLLTRTEVAAAYFRLIDLTTERADAIAAEDTAASTLAILDARVASGAIAPAERDRRRIALSDLRSDRIAIDRDLAATRHALALLVGAESLPDLAPASAAPVVPAIPAGLPSTMLARRPDVSAAIASVDAARLRHRAARTAWFPSFELTGNGGQASTSLAALLSDTARTFGFTLLLSLPVFDGGRNRARVERAAAQLDLATAEQRATILAAFRDVEDALSAARLVAEESTAAADAAATTARARDLAERRFAAGAISRLDLLEAVRQDLAARARAARFAHARAVAAVRLIRALGGGWSDTPAALDLAAVTRH